MVKKFKLNNMKNLKKYNKPKFTIIDINTDELLQIIPTSPNDGGDVGGTTEDPLLSKGQNFRIFDDSDDWSGEDY